MLTGFPESAIINVPNSVANDLLKAAEVLPLYDNKDFYSVPLDVCHQHSSLQVSC